jgi:carotenoid cleavage dioxygenase
MHERESTDSPFLRGNYAPWPMEGDAPHLEVVGELPHDLNGTFYRNGPNPAFRPRGRYHWFDGDGMIHAITLHDGRASYRNRWVQSATLREEQAAGRALATSLLDLQATEAPRLKNAANTNILFHAGKLLALVESSLPTQLVPCTLETLGEYDFDGRLSGPMTAHPKMDPETGEMLFFGYSPFPPYLVYHVCDATGALLRSEPIDVPWPSMVHDFAITRDEVVFLHFPLVFSFEDMRRRGGAFTWEPERGTRIGVMPRRGGNADVRWFETEAAYAFHPMNAYRDGDALVVDVARYRRIDFMSPRNGDDRIDRDGNLSRMHRWTVDLANGGVRDQPLDDLGAEFPRVDERRLGRRHRFGYAAVQTETRGAMPEYDGIRAWDLDRNSTQTRSFGPGAGAGEPLFVPRHAAADENDGYVLVLVYDPARNASDFHVLDARNLAGEPIATVRLPHRIPYGFHGNWVPSA